MNFKYINSKGEVVDFSTFPYILRNAELLNYNWLYDVAEGKNNKLKNIRRGIGEKTISITVMADYRLPKAQRMEQFANAVNQLYEIVDYDVTHNVDGKLVSNSGWYLPCRLLSSAKTNWKLNKSFLFNEFQVVSAKNCWIKEYTKQFFKTDDESIEQDANADYPYDYEYDYTAGRQKGRDILELDCLSDSDFKLTIYGPASSPYVRINNYLYMINAEIYEGESLVVDTKAGTVVKLSSTSTVSNMFDARNKEPSIFKKLPPGSNTVLWTGNFGFDITTYIERGEPEWI